MAASKSSTVRAVGYARRSTDMQERSIPDQQAYVEKWAKAASRKQVFRGECERQRGGDIHERERFQRRLRLLPLGFLATHEGAGSRRDGHSARSLSRTWIGCLSCGSSDR